MYIDCASCPGRHRACDGCMMNLFVEPVTSGDGDDLGGRRVVREVGDSDAEICSAVDVFAAASMVSTESARSAKLAIGPACGPASRPGLRILRAG